VVQLDQMFQVDFAPDEIDRDSVDRDELKRLLTEDAEKLYAEREGELGEELMRALERYLLLQIIDQRWREHLYDMDYLREGIHCAASRRSSRSSPTRTRRSRSSRT
jgi:preprotein translocase subunit SecA